MARFGKTTIELSTTVSKLVQDINEISNDVGNVNRLPNDSNVVDAIERIDSSMGYLLDSNRLGVIVNSQFNRTDTSQTLRGGTSILDANIDSAEIDDLLVRNSMNVLGTTVANSITATNVNLSSITMDAVSSLAHVKQLKILDSGGTPILAGYLISTSNTSGTL